MFNLKLFSKSQETEPKGESAQADQKSANIRTLKKDYEDFKVGKMEEQPVPETPAYSAPQEAINVSLGSIGSSKPLEVAGAKKAQIALQPQEPAPPSGPEISLPVKSGGKPASLPKTPTPSATAKTPQVPAVDKGLKAKMGIKSTLGSDNFYHDQPSFENVGEELTKQEKASSAKSGKLAASIIVILILLIGSGGFYYWWFYIKNPANSDVSSEITNQDEEVAAKYSRLTIDPSLDSVAIKMAMARYANEFLSSAAENELREAKLVSPDNQPLAMTTFQELFNFQLPEGLSGSLGTEYSIFMKKENGEVRIGAVFQLTKTQGISEKILLEEPNIISSLNSFYLDTDIPKVNPVFQSSKHGVADIRYYNFLSPANTSLDYSVIQGQESDYFIFSTSKYSIRSIIDYLAGK